MIKATSQVFDEDWSSFCLVSIDEVDSLRLTNKHRLVILDAELSEGVISPCENLPFCCQEACEQISTHHFNDWDVEVKRVWD